MNTSPLVQLARRAVWRTRRIVTALSGLAVAGLTQLLMFQGGLAADEPSVRSAAGTVRYQLSDEGQQDPDDGLDGPRNPFRLIQQDGAEPLGPVPQPFSPTPAAPAAAEQLAALIFGDLSAERSLLSESRQALVRTVPSDVVLGREAQLRATSDAGSLLRKSNHALGISTQRRTPIVTDPRVRGNSTGGLLTSGSYWLPARLDLDTMVSKIDSRIVEDVVVVKGPYSALYGPGTGFLDIELLGSPRFADGFESHGSTSLDFQTNSEHWYGRQTLLGGSDNWGYRIGYGHRTANDYRTGAGTYMPASFNSRDIDFALGFDLSPDQQLEFSYLRLDQTGVEYPGQFFDMDWLVTDAFELIYTQQNLAYADNLRLEGWYNRTRFEGDAQNPGKRMQIPALDEAFESAFTQVDSHSSGYSAAVSWGQVDQSLLTVGTDMRYISQKLDEFANFVVDFTPLGGPVVPLNDVNSPVPRSHSLNPGWFAELDTVVSDRLRIHAGGRIDYVGTDVDRTPRGLTSGIGFPPGEPPPFDGAFADQQPITQQAILDQLGADDFRRDFALWGGHVTMEYDVDDFWTLGGGVGFGMRPPLLTELYVNGANLALLQNGLNSFLGNPNLDAPRHLQLDLNLSTDYGWFRGGVNGFHAWVRDYITYEVILLNLLAAEPNSRTVQFINTPLATLTGFDAYMEVVLTPRLTAFGTLSYVEGRDQRRDVSGATASFPGIVPMPPRGILPASDKEPLPGIAPMESRLGLRYRSDGSRPFGLEFAARVVDSQDRVATSLLEMPTPGFATFDIRGFWQATPGLLLVGGVENLADRFYREHLDLRTGLGVFQPGINFYFGTQLDY